MPDRDIRKSIAEDAAAKRNVVFALGAYSLIHAGTVRFLERARSQSDVLYAAVVGDEPGRPSTSAAAGLLKIPERARILREMLPVSDAAVLGVEAEREIAAWIRLVPGGLWVWNHDESDCPEPLRRIVEENGGRITALEGDASCTTEILLARMQAAAAV